MANKKYNFSDEEILGALEKHGSKSKAAESLGIPRSSYRDLLKKVEDTKEICDEYPKVLYGIGVPEMLEKAQKDLNQELKGIIDQYWAPIANCGAITDDFSNDPGTFIYEEAPVTERTWNYLLDGRKNTTRLRDPEDNSCILVISDLHAPYQHKDTMDFLAEIYLEYQPTRVIGIGDELDYHAMSFHTSDPNLDSAGTELCKARKFIKELHSLFPKMDLVHSNHGSMVYRRGKEHGIPKHILRSYNEVLGVPTEDWKWHEDLTLKLPNGQYVNFHHGRSNDTLKISQSLGMSYVQGHYHGQFSIQYWSSPVALNWAMNVGCLIDDSSLAFAYNKVSAKRPIIGVGMIADSIPQLIPMILDSNGDWIGKIL